MAAFLEIAVFTALPAALGVVAAWVLTVPAFRALAPESRRTVRALLLVPLTAPMFGVVVANFATRSTGIPAGVFAAFGAAAFATAMAQGVIGRKALLAVAADPSNYGRGLVLMAFLNTIVLFAFVLNFLAVSRTNGSEPAAAPFVYDAMRWMLFAAAAAVTAFGQAVVVHRSETPFAPASYGKTMVRVAVLEVATAAGFVAVFLSITGAEAAV